ncbi:hypothetical protein APA_1588 [Pseudanabaena sp. lw0831]|nr:hypothetical protein APA_1588 [Pseudanabaena sp. lw0831]
MLSDTFRTYAEIAKTLIPQPLLPEREKGSKKIFLFPSPFLGEGLGVRVLAISA